MQDQKSEQKDLRTDLIFDEDLFETNNLVCESTSPVSELSNSLDQDGNYQNFYPESQNTQAPALSYINNTQAAVKMIQAPCLCGRQVQVQYPMAPEQAQDQGASSTSTSSSEHFEQANGVHAVTQPNLAVEEQIPHFQVPEMQEYDLDHYSAQLMKQDQPLASEYYAKKSSNLSDASTAENKNDSLTDSARREDFLLKMNRLKQKDQQVKNQKTVNEFMSRCNRYVKDIAMQRGLAASTQRIRKPHKLFKDDWFCSGCQNINYNQRDTCLNCSWVKDEKVISI